MKIKFGTDGWRGIIADDFTCDNVRVCARGVAAYVQRSGVSSAGLVVGYDTRFASEYFAQAAAEVLTASGIPVYLCGEFAPTPVISFAVRELGAAGAIIITASHTPGHYNGVKFRSAYGGAASAEELAHIQAAIDEAVQGSLPVERTTLSAATQAGLLESFDPQPAYFRHLAALVDLERIRQAPLHLVVDPMYGAGQGYFPALLQGGRVRLTEIHGTRHPLFPGLRAPEPVPENLDELRQTVAAGRADLGLANDGDADRLALVDEAGRSLDNFQVYPLLLAYLLAVRGARGPVVKTVATSSLVDRVAARFGAPVQMTGVGFTHIAPAMVRSGAIFGGEESGGYAFGDHLPERDGILAGLRVVDMVVHAGKPLSRLLCDLQAEYGVYYYQRRDVPFSPKLRAQVNAALKSRPPDRLGGQPVLGMITVDGLRLDLADGSWLLMRLSGTEPVIRICGESLVEERVPVLLVEGARLLGLQL